MLLLFKVPASRRIKDVCPELLARFGFCTPLDSTVHSLVAPANPAVWDPLSASLSEARGGLETLTGTTCCTPCRSISCWALSRYAQWIVERCSDPQQDANAAYIQLDEVLQVSITITFVINSSLIDSYLTATGRHVQLMHILRLLRLSVSVCVPALACHP